MARKINWAQWTVGTHISSIAWLPETRNEFVGVGGLLSGRIAAGTIVNRPVVAVRENHYPAIVGAKIAPTGDHPMAFTPKALRHIAKGCRAAATLENDPTAQRLRRRRCVSVARRNRFAVG